jgi:putative nucleotidyltransferase with HDIG domain
MRAWSSRTLLQRFTIATALLTAGLAIGLSALTVGVIETFVIREEANVAAEAVLRTFSAQLKPDDFRRPLDAGRRRFLDALFVAHGISDKVLRVRLWRADGVLLYSNGPEVPVTTRIAADLSSPQGYRKFVRARAKTDGSARGRVFVPVQVGTDKRTLGAFEIFYDLNLLNERLAKIKRTIWIAVPAGFVLLYASVFVLVRRSSIQMLRQQHALLAAHLGTYQALARAIDAKDAYTGDHSSRVAQFAELLAQAVKLPERHVEEVKMAARLHDIGKIAVPDAILTKPGPLTQEEWETMRRHAQAGYTILREAPLPEGVKRAVLHSHERWDGKGYPKGLAGEEIPIAARILSIADAYEAMTNDRPYRPAFSETEALSRLRGAAGSQFDPALVEAFVHVALTASKEASYNEVSRSRTATRGKRQRGRIEFARERPQ